MWFYALLVALFAALTARFKTRPIGKIPQVAPVDKLRVTLAILLLVIFLGEAGRLSSVPA